MSAVLMTLFAVSILGALGMAFYGLRVLISRWEQPRRFQGPSAPEPAVVQQVRPMPAPQQVQPSQQVQPPVWVAPAGVAPPPMTALPGLATPPPIVLPPAYSPAAPPSFAAPPVPPRSSRVAPPPPPPPWTPPHRAPTPGQVSGLASEPGRLARGSIPPDFTDDLDLEPDTDPGIPVIAQPEPVVQRGARFSVVRSSRR
jgi:hypothetical protein